MAANARREPTQEELELIAWWEWESMADFSWAAFTGNFEDLEAIWQQDSVKMRSAYEQAMAYAITGKQTAAAKLLQGWGVAGVRQGWGVIAVDLALEAVALKGIVDAFAICEALGARKYAKAFVTAAAHGQLGFMRLCRAKCAALGQTVDLDTALVRAARNGYENTVIQLLHWGAPITDETMLVAKVSSKAVIWPLLIEAREGNLPPLCERQREFGCGIRPEPRLGPKLEFFETSIPVYAPRTQMAPVQDASEMCWARTRMPTQPDSDDKMPPLE